MRTCQVGTTEDVGDGRLYFRPAGSSKEGADRDTLFSLVMMVDVAGARAAVESDRVRILEEVRAARGMLPVAWAALLGALSCR